MTIPRISVFTPSHHPTFLDKAEKSLERQTMKDWEWIVVLNAGAEWTPRPDGRVKVTQAPEGYEGNVGALKALACATATGEILLELDHDDELTAGALARVSKAFIDNPDVGLVYSDCAQINADGSMNTDRFDESNGWTYRKVTVDGRKQMKVEAMEPLPHNVSYIWYAPNHLRAFRRDIYDAAGGYDTDRSVLDDQELMARMYLLAPFHHLRSLLYLQRVHSDSRIGGNAQSDADRNKAIQVETVRLYDRTIQPAALAWATREGLLSIDLGAAHNSPEGYNLLVDKEIDGRDVLDVLSELPTSSVGVIRAADFLEHIAEPVDLMNEAYRVLAHGGMLLTMTPSTDGRGAWQDPTHVSYWNENSFWYYTEAAYAKYVPEIECRFQLSRCFTGFPSPWHEAHKISYVCANLIAIKNGPRLGGYLQW